MIKTTIYKFASIFLIVLFFTIDATAQIATQLGTVRDKTNLDIGFNRRSDNGTWWTDNTYIDRVAEMNPDVVRYPGGTQANYWDWSTGKFLDNTDKPWGNKEVLHIPEFINALPTRTKIIYVVNLARPTPATGVSVNASEATLKSTTTLNAKIVDMIDALDEFVAQGKEPFAVEIGNEFFFGNIESGIFHITQENDGWHSGWDTANNQSFVSANKKEATIINAKFYLDQCKIVVAGIKAAYPNMKFALVSTKRGNGNSTRERWNNTIYDELATNPDFASLQPDVYALTQHHYVNDNYGDQTIITNNATAKVAIAEGIQYPIDRQQDYTQVPNDYKIWYTEYGATKNNAEETWATGMRFAALAISWMDRGNKVGQLDYHYISDNNVIKIGSPMKLAPIGIAAKLLAQASADMTEMQEITFANNPVSVNGVDALHGYKFKSNEKETLFIININNTNYQVDFSNLFTYSGQATMAQYYSNQPYVSSVFNGHANIQTTSGNVTNTFTANNFSITTIEILNTILSVENVNDIGFSLYPNPVKDNLSISSFKNINSVSIYSLRGVLVLSKENPSNLLDLSMLSLGIYLVKIESDNGFSIKKIIKQ